MSFNLEFFEKEFHLKWPMLHGNVLTDLILDENTPVLLYLCDPS